MTEESPYSDLETVEFTGTVTLDLYDRVDELLSQEIPAIREEKAEYEEALRRGVHEELAEADDGELTTAEENELRQYIRELEEQRKRLKHNARLFHTCAEKWGGSEFEVRRNLAFHEVQGATDDIRRMTVQSGEPQEAADAKTGAYKLRVLQFGIVDSPPETPDVNGDEFPWQVGEWLYEQFDAINSSGEGDSMGNSSQEQRPATNEP